MAPLEIDVRFERPREREIVDHASLLVMLEPVDVHFDAKRRAFRRYLIHLDFHGVSFVKAIRPARIS